MPLNRHRVQNNFDFPLEEGQLLILEPAGQQELDPEVFFSYKEKLSSKGYTLLYIPYIVNAISTDTIRYYVPGYNGDQSIEEIQSRVSNSLGLEIHSPLAIKRKRGNLIVIESDKSGATTEMLLSSLVEDLPQNNVQKSLIARVLPTIAGAILPVHGIINDFSEEICEVEETCCYNTCPKISEANIDSEDNDLLHFVLTKKEEELREFGMSEKLIQYLLELKDTSLSRIRINRYGKIILEDYNKEIEMDTKTKALYFLYLRHPEGIVIKDLPQYEEEAYDLYQSISRRDDTKAQRAAIRNLLDPYKGDVHSCLSRIKRAFLEKMSELKAKNYYVDGQRAEKRSIALDRNMVIWETIR